MLMPVHLSKGGHCFSHQVCDEKFSFQQLNLLKPVVAPPQKNHIHTFLKSVPKPEGLLSNWAEFYHPEKRKIANVTMHQ